MCGNAFGRVVRVKQFSHLTEISLAVSISPLDSSLGSFSTSYWLLLSEQSLLSDETSEETGTTMGCMDFWSVEFEFSISAFPLLLK